MNWLGLYIADSAEVRQVATLLDNGVGALLESMHHADQLFYFDELALGDSFTDKFFLRIRVALPL